MPSPQPRRPAPADRLRQATVVVALLVGILGVLVGTGVLGERVAESSGGALAADATLLAPAGTAFAIWSVIYLGLAGYTVYQLTPGAASDRRHRRTGYLAAASLGLNAAWLLVTQWGWLWVSVLVMAMLVGVLGVLVRRLHEIPSYGLAETLLVDGTFGLYLGWVCVAACANVTATLVASCVDPARPVAEGAALAVLAVVVVVAGVLARRVGPRLSVAAAICWGLVWIAAGRLADEPASTVVGLGALVAAAAVAAVTVRERSRRLGGASSAG